MAAPHRVVDDIADGVVNAANGLGNSLAGAIRGAGKSIMGALDKPFTAITGKEGPHHIIDRLVDGAVDTIVNIGSDGMVGSAKKAGEAVMKALDQPVEQVGIPPKLEGLGILPKLGIGRK